MMQQTLTQWMQDAFRRAFPQLEAQEQLASIEVFPATDERFGDYQCNAAMPLAKILRQKPRDIASAALDHAPSTDLVESKDIAGPGFINLRLSSEALAGAMEAMSADDRLGVPAPGQGRSVVMDYSSPNVAKPMHIGHIRSTVIGNALDRLHRHLGFRVIADNHVGDWGTQFGLLILGYRSFCDPAALETDPIGELERIYRESYERSEQDEGWREEARRELVKLQQGDPDNVRLWERFVDLSKQEFQRIYDRLGVSFDLVRGESHYREALPGVLETLESRGLATESEGARVVFLEEENLPVCIVRKRDGGFNYATTDIATVLSRDEEFAPESIIYITDERQQLHFNQFFAIARKLGVQARLIHVWFGLMRLPDATFSTRQGNVIKLEKLLDEAEERARAMVREASPGMAEQDQRDVARAVGIGAVKYADLSQNPQSVVTFTWEKALSLDGNSAPYLQYAHARIASVRDKYRERFPGGTYETAPIRLAETVERKLALKLIRFGDTVERAAGQYKPNLLADYLYELAQIYSSFYQNVPFLKADEGVRESRVRLCDLVARTLRRGLDLLGIETPDRI